MNRLKGRKIVITGAARGMGKATAELFHKEGAALFLIDVNQQDLANTAKALNCHSHMTDVSNAGAVATAIENAHRSMEGIDGIVSAAGILYVRPIEETSSEDFMNVLQVNLLGPFNIIKAALPHLRKCENATVVNIASVGGLLPWPNHFAYGASKAALLALGKGLAQDLAPRIRVNSVCPGFVKTEMTRASWEDPEKFKLATAANVLHRLGTSEEVANMCLFLTCAESAYSTGTSFILDGGLSWH